MVTLCSIRDVLDEAGEGVNADVTASSALVTRFIEKIEGDIVGATRRNWVGDFASVNTYVKELLKECCSAGAGMKAIKYDMSGYTSRQEAVTMVNMLFDIYSRTLKQLKDLETTEIRAV